jgi:LysM repeat protein
MALTPMQYKGFVWPHNPRTYSIRYERRVAVHKVPFGRYAMQDLGLGRRVMTGEGEFYGPGAYDTFRKLASVFYSGGPGTLIHPVWQSASVYFVELTLAQEPRTNYVRYTFTFWEDCDKYAQGLTKKPAAPAVTVQTPAQTAGEYHTMLQGETLWSVAQAWGITLGALLELNPQIKNPNTVAAGEKVRVK